MDDENTILPWPVSGYSPIYKTKMTRPRPNILKKRRKLFLAQNSKHVNSKLNNNYTDFGTIFTVGELKDQIIPQKISKSPLCDLTNVHNFKSDKPETDKDCPNLKAPNEDLILLKNSPEQKTVEEPKKFTEIINSNKTTNNTTNGDNSNLKATLFNRQRKRNLRERNRVKMINRAFNGLKQRLPLPFLLRSVPFFPKKRRSNKNFPPTRPDTANRFAQKMIDVAAVPIGPRGPEQISIATQSLNEESSDTAMSKISKVETLRLAIQYINHLRNILNSQT